MNDPFLQARLRPLARRRQSLRLGCRLAACWLLTTLTGAALVSLVLPAGARTAWVLAPAALAGAGAAAWLARRERRTPTDWHGLALAVESRHPNLEGRLITAIEQDTPPGREPGYLQRRLVDEALDHSCGHDWTAAIPRARVLTAQAAHLLALALLAFVFLNLRSAPPTRSAPVLRGPGGLTVTPGDTAIERGQSLVVMAQFGGTLPSSVELVLESRGDSRRIPLVRSLSDPLFGGTVPEVTNHLQYRLEYGGQRTRDYQVTVFEHPRLERADAAVLYPDYTRLAPQRVPNTRRVSAVEGSRLDLTLQLNKPVVSAQLVARSGAGTNLALQVDAALPVASLAGFPLLASRTYDLHLVDADGRTNKVPAQFVFTALTNRVPELKLASPRGDLRPSALEEILFDGQVWDDFGVESYGLTYTLVDQEPQSIALGQAVPGREQRAFRHLLRLEDLHLEPDQLVSWHVWAEDIGPDGQRRRTEGDLFFGEIRPFEEIFREGQGRDASSQQQQSGDEASGDQGNPSARLAEVQKQIINATWKLRRDHSATRTPPPTGADQPKTAPPGSYAADATVVRDAQAQALDQAEAAAGDVDDPRTAAFWSTVTDQMETALKHLDQALESTQPLPAALSAEQAAYQALLKLQQREYEVARSRRSQRGQQAGGRQQQMQRQLDQLELTQSEDRYETERQAQAPQTAERREQLQVLNRLQELARRQQDLNDRLRELQTALQEARSDAEREEIRRQLKRLQEEEQQMLADADELLERLDRPENQSRLAEQRQQMEQARQEMQRAAEAAAQGAVSQALAAGTRAERQLEEARDDLRRSSAGEFAEDLRSMRTDARELTRQQSEIERQLDTLADPQRKNLSDAAQRQELLDRLAQQKSRLTNLTERATQLSQETEASEPLVARELYDSLRKFSQDEAVSVQQLQEELVERGILTQRTYDRLRETAANDGAKSLEVTAEMLRQGLLPQADRAEERARTGIGDLRRGIERAAERVLGDDTEALRLAQRELDALAEALDREAGRAERSGTNATGQAQGRTPSPTADPRDPSQSTNRPPRSLAQDGQRPGNQPSPQPGQQPDAAQARAEPQPGARPGQAGESAAGERQGPPQGQPQAGQPDASPSGTPQQARREGGQQPSDAGANQPSGPRQDGPGGRGGTLADTLDTLFEGDRRGGTGSLNGPLTGDDFVPWSDRLREVEELVDFPSLRGDLARARERARQVRAEYKRDLKKPDWAVVRLEVMGPLVEVRRQIAEELARREPRDGLVPIDRDPVPARFSDLVRRYYEDLSRGKTADRR